MDHRKLALLLLAALPIVANAQWNPIDNEKRLQPEQFAIMVWGITQGKPQLLADMYDCGINLAGFVSPKDLKAVQKAKLKCVVYDPSINIKRSGQMTPADLVDKAIHALSKIVNKSPAVYAYCLLDEPQAIDFPELAQWSKAIAKYSPSKLAYINLYPNYASRGQLQANSYDEYLETFIKTLSPKYISYDHYAMMDDGTIRDGYFQNLESARSASLKHGIPFWNIVLATAHFTYAEPSYASMRFQVFTSLAYGVKGISYFTYFAPDIGNYRLAAVDPFGHKTPTWDMLRSVNMQIHKLGPTYLKLKSVGVFHHPNVPSGCRGIADSKLIESVEGGDLLVGEFVNPEGKPYAIIVNKSLTQNAAINIKFKNAGEVWKVNPYTGEPRAFAGEDPWLAPGQGMMLYVK